MTIRKDEDRPGDSGLRGESASSDHDEMGGEAPCQMHRLWDLESSDESPEISGATEDHPSESPSDAGSDAPAASVEEEFREAVDAVKRHINRPR